MGGEGFGERLYVISVVGGNTYSIYAKMGVGKRPDATVLGNVQSEDMFINGKGFWGNIFNKHIVVVGNTYSIYTKMDGGPHSARRYRRDCKDIKMYRYINAVRSGDQFFYPSSRNFNFVAR